MIRLKIPNKLLAEKEYIIDVLFSEFLGLEYTVQASDDVTDYEITPAQGRSLVIRDRFFGRFNSHLEYLQDEEIPAQVTHAANQFAPDGIILVFGDDECSVTAKSIVCGCDIFASSFFMLTRWEEFVSPVRDQHDRFPASASLAFKSGILHRAVVNEYVEMLWRMLRYLGCNQERKRREFRIIPTHDVDAPFLYGTQGSRLALRQMAGDIVRRKSAKLAFHNASMWFQIRRGRTGLDPYYTFDSIMDISDRHALRSTFLFITEGEKSSRGGGYNTADKNIRQLFKDISQRGHAIGLHASYNSFKNALQTKRELEILKCACDEEGIVQNHWMSRQHFLRWETPTTFENLEEAGIDVDSTLSFADVAGFRCGVCYEYPTFNVLARKMLRLREMPLLIMECTVIDEQYMNLGTGEVAYAMMTSLKDTCRRFSGDYVLLWHNTRMVDHQERDLYCQVLDA